jgi:antitoxin Phd
MSRRAAESHATRSSWQLQTAKAQFSEVFRRARTEGPQLATRQNKEAVIILPVEEFERRSGRAQQPQKLSDFFASSPLARSKIKLDRDSGPESAVAGD